MKRTTPFVRDDTAASAAEFAMIVPVFLILLLGMIDVGRYMWTINQAEKATQMGARYAVVTNPVPVLLTQDFNIEHGSTAGDPVDTGDFNTATCTSTGAGNATCTITGGLSSENAADAAAFGKIIDWMKTFYPTVDYPNVRIIYKNVGLGFAGDPHGPDVAALTTIELHDVTFQPLILFGGSINLPDVKAMLTLEDASCTVADETNCDSSN